MVDKRTLATIILVLTWVLFAYYTIWILVTPALDANYWMQDYFPDRMYGILPTSLLAYLILAYMFTFSGIALITDSENKSFVKPESRPKQNTANPNEAEKSKLEWKLYSMHKWKFRLLTIF